MSDRRKTVNRDLPALPSHQEVARAILDAPESDPRARRGISANIVAQHLGVVGARRAGNGAVKGSWSGTMSGSLRIAPTLRAMERAGLLRSIYDTTAHRHTYSLTATGKALAVSVGHEHAWGPWEFEYASGGKRRERRECECGATASRKVAAS